MEPIDNLYQKEHSLMTIMVTVSREEDSFCCKQIFGSLEMMLTLWHLANKRAYLRGQKLCGQ